MKAKNLVKGFVAAAALAVMASAVPAASVQAEEAQGTYTVDKGDNLCKIAQKVYGSPTLWKVIYEANSNIVKSNYIIYSGQTLIIPAVNNNTPAVTAPAAPVVTDPVTPVVTAPAAPVVTAPTATAPAAPVVTAPAATTPAAPAATTPAAPTATTPTAPAATPPAQGQEYTLDYNAIASWVDHGFIGNDSHGAPVVMALNASSEYAIIIFGDSSNRTAVSFVGPIIYEAGIATIIDETNNLSLTFKVVEINDMTIMIDRGDIGTATLTGASRVDVLNTIKIAIEHYKHTA